MTDKTNYAARPEGTQPWIPLGGGSKDGYNDGKEATATCFCGDIQLAFPVTKEGIKGTFVCHCTDCRKVSASMFATNFTVHSDDLRYIRGADKVKTYAQSKTIVEGNTMTNYFCPNCGSLLNRISSGTPTLNYVRVGAVDDLRLHDTLLKPEVEQFVDSRAKWLKPVQGVTQAHGMEYWK
ncbi:uncharacterized protein I303_101196 [Kwoniella dejecticola CBS 10117]|uniref:CENP-V/GFA domain-containing protein n=1 Tax=Kwoniella dejecticola CBS 10117 TaxID=1296121 RepID=A0A1A6AH11_9TREE|nr:uncharacterized protein I303_01202 [Kwoniella dejecticola CBS 10117]OBR89375.1 hypothetical protein I303_01202 [Kwoniella dejecticola CBS 10117]